MYVHLQLGYFSSWTFFADEKALQFIQAEKLYYEKALIDLGDLLATSGSANDNDDNQVDEPATVSFSQIERGDH